MGEKSSGTPLLLQHAQRTLTNSRFLAYYCRPRRLPSSFRPARAPPLSSLLNPGNGQHHFQRIRHFRRIGRSRATYSGSFYVSPMCSRFFATEGRKKIARLNDPLKRSSDAITPEYRSPVDRPSRRIRKREGTHLSRKLFKRIAKVNEKGTRERSRN